MPARESEVLVGRRNLERGFLDAAMKLFIRNAEHVTSDGWTVLAGRLLRAESELQPMPPPRRTKAVR